MKKLAKLLSIALTLVLCASIFVGCSKVSQSYADKINEAAEKDEHVTYEQVMKDLGDGAIDVTVELLGQRSGAITAVKGCKTAEEAQAKIESGDAYEYIVITIVNGKATAAEYEKVEAKEE